MIADSRKPTVYGYARVSTDKQDPECAAQKKAIEDRFRTQFQPEGCFWGGHFVDPATSAAVHYLDRPKGAESFRVMKPGDILIISKMDRAFRSLVDFGKTMELWKKNKIQVIVLDIGMDATTEVGEFIAGIMVLVGQWERRRIRNRIKESRAALVEQGRVFGRRPFGFTVYKKQDPRTKKMVQAKRPWPEERELMARMAAWEEAGLTINQIATLANGDPLKRPEKERWNKNSVRNAIDAHYRLADAG